jgi:hypothetical protein
MAEKGILENSPEIGQSHIPSFCGYRDLKAEMSHVLTAGGGAPDRSRTCNLLIRSQKLYPIELRVLNRLQWITLQLPSN